jgi:hypothetical protein
MNPWRWVDPRIDRVRLAHIRGYFLGRGWKSRPNPNAALLRFEKPGHGGQPPVFQVFPASEQAVDFRQRVMELVTTLSELEDRHPVAVLEEMLTTAEANPDLDGAEAGSKGGTVRPL